MKISSRIGLCAVFCILLVAKGFCQDITVLQNKKILIFSKTVGYRHESIPTGIKFFKDLGKQTGFGVDTTENSQNLLTPILKTIK